MAKPNQEGEKDKKAPEAAASAPPPQGAELMAAAPSALMQAGFTLPEGFEESDLRQDLKISRMVLLQALSPEIQQDPNRYRQGEWMDSVTKEVLGKSFDFVPIKWFTQRIKWIPRENGGGRECVSMNGQTGSIARTKPLEYGTCADCKFSAWRPKAERGPKDNGAPDCTLYKNFLGFIPGTVGFPVVLAFDRSKAKHGEAVYKALLEKAMLEKKPMWGYALHIDTYVDRNKQMGTDFWNVKWTIKGPSTAEQNAYGKSLFDTFGKKPIVVDLEHPEGQPDIPGGGGATEAAPF